MTLLELKKSIHDKIDKLDDPDYLELIESMIDRREAIFVIPEHMKEGINQGKEDIKNGRVHTMADFEQKYEQWLRG